MTSPWLFRDKFCCRSCSPWDPRLDYLCTHLTRSLIAPLPCQKGVWACEMDENGWTWKGGAKCLVLKEWWSLKKKTNCGPAARWWQLKYVYFHPNPWGRWVPNFDFHNFSNGLVQPPTGLGVSLNFQRPRKLARLLVDPRTRYFNIFHPMDPVAYRIEPLIAEEPIEPSGPWFMHHGGWLGIRIQPLNVSASYDCCIDLLSNLWIFLLMTSQQINAW